MTNRLEDTPKKPQLVRTIKNLRLDLKQASEGRTWLLLPEGFRDQDCGSTYLLPTSRTELTLIANIYHPDRKNDSGCQYIRRAQRKLRELSRVKQSAILDLDHRHEKIRTSHKRYDKAVLKNKSEMRASVEAVKKVAEEAIASLTDLFALGRKIIDGQLKAHYANKEWKGEMISARAARESFRMIIQGVKGLGLPSDQRQAAKESVNEELAAALEDTEDALSLAPSGKKETEH